jgi:prevent-host-death family protein
VPVVGLALMVRRRNAESQLAGHQREMLAHSTASLSPRGARPLPIVGHYDRLGYMEDQVFNIAEAKTHLSRLIERVERGERITIARNNRPVAIISPAKAPIDSVLSRLRSVREAIRQRNHGQPVRRGAETWRDFIDSGRRI